MKIRVGLGLGVTASVDHSAETFWSIVDACESLGWDSLWLSERVTGAIYDPLAAMAAAVGRTKKLKFGTSVLVLPGRNPVLLAKELATIDLLSDGRIVPAVGLGAEEEAEQRVFGVDRAEAAGRTEEAVVLMKRLWAEDRVTHEGKYFRVQDLALRPRPAQRPGPDVWFGGHSKAAIRRVGRIGDGWLPSFVTPAEYGPAREAIARIAGEAGRRVDPEHYGALVPYVPGRARPGSSAEPLLAVLRKRRPEVDLAEVMVTGDDAALRAHLERFVAEGASKFLIVPLTEPADWGEELARLRETVVRPLESQSS